MEQPLLACSNGEVAESVHAGMQHDVAEFLAHVLTRLPFTMNKLAIPWQARSLGQHRRVQDQGQSAPMVLQHRELAGQPSLCRQTVQDMINAWHRQEDVHALVCWPSAIVLQAGRFDFDAGHNRALKRRYEIEPSPLIKMPGFERDQALHWKQYQLCSIIVHLGDSPDSGHYLNLMFDIRDSPYRIADDGIASRACDISEVDSYVSDMYLFFYCESR